MVERVIELAGGYVDLALIAAPGSDILPELLRTVNDPQDVLSLTNFEAAEDLGVRLSIGTEETMRNDVIGQFADLDGEGRFSSRSPGSST